MLRLFFDAWGRLGPVGCLGRHSIAAVPRMAVCAAVLVGAVCACTPDYDWRSIANRADGYTIDLPAKPMADEREINLAGRPMRMKVQSARAGNAVFAIGTVILPSDEPRLRQTMLDDLRLGLAHNVRAAPVVRAISVPLVTGGEAPGLEMSLSGEAGEKREFKIIQVRLVARGQHIYQATIIADKALPREQVDQFFLSFRLY
jgi:hypothetical protein